MSGTERVIYEKLCADCADKLRAAKFAVEEQASGGDKLASCQLCSGRGFFSLYKVYSRRSRRRAGA